MAAPGPAVLAGMVSSTLFVVSYLPMLVKAYRTRDLASYSLGNLVLANAGNAIHSVYVFRLPVGPIWFLHTFYLVSTIAMLVGHRRYADQAVARPPGARADSDGAIGETGGALDETRRALVVDHIGDAAGDTAGTPDTAGDLRMPCYVRGRERSLDQLGEQAMSAGLQVSSVRPAGSRSVIELRPSD